MLLARFGGSSGKLYVDDVFSTYLYTGNGSTQTINNGIDLAGKGGLVWTKTRGVPDNHKLFDTVRGVNNHIQSNTTTQAQTVANSLTAFNSSGFTLGSDTTSNLNTNTYVSWTFRKAPKFFDVVTYTGNGVAGRQIPHSLGVAPGVIIVKKTNVSGNDWVVYHRGAGNNQQGWLNTTDQFIATGYWNNTNPDATSFYLGSNTNVNNLNDTYVAYLFAHDTSADGIIQCGSFTTDGSGNATVNLGWEPQWGMVKASSTTGSWLILDSMRGWVNGGGDSYLMANSSSQEGVMELGYPNATGFTMSNAPVSTTYIYLAIRRPNKPPTSATEVFGLDDMVNFFASSPPLYRSALIAPDFILNKVKNNTTDWYISDRLRQALSNTSKTNAEASNSNWTWDYMNGVNKITPIGSSATSYFFRRAPGFFDVVCYTGTGVDRTVNHNLGVVPELMIVKSRSLAYSWSVLSPTLKRLVLNTTASENGSSTTALYFGDGTNVIAPTSSVFSVFTVPEVNSANETYVAYLFATLPGVSKVGSYTGNGGSQTINCGFTTGARFVLVKRTDSAGDWFVWDTVRGIVAANDPHLSLNTTAAEVTTDDSIDPDASGFIVNQNAATNINVNGASYIFLAIS